MPVDGGGRALFAPCFVIRGAVRSSHTAKYAPGGDPFIPRLASKISAAAEKVRLRSSLLTPGLSADRPGDEKAASSGEPMPPKNA